jgi:hypothetical protein
MTVVCHDKSPVRRIDQAFWNQNQIMIYDELLSNISAASGNGEAMEAAKAVLDRFGSESA